MNEDRLRAQDVLAWLAHEGRDTFTIDDLVEHFHVPRPRAQDVASRMAKANRAHRLTRGLYLALEANHWNHPEMPLVANWHLIAARLAGADDHYLAYYTAMEIHRMVQHPLTTVFVATSVQRPRITVGPMTFRFVKVASGRFFGIEQRQLERGRAVEVTDLERTFLDGADRLDLCGGVEEVVRGFTRRHDDLNADRLLRYVLEFGRPVTTKRLGFLLEIAGHGEPKLMWELERLARRLGNYAPLVPGAPSEGARRSRRWELTLNADPERLLAATRT